MYVYIHMPVAFLCIRGRGRPVAGRGEDCVTIISYSYISEEGAGREPVGGEDGVIVL